jgi:hypothetical protein
MNETQHARAFARLKLEEMGPMTRAQGTLLFVLMAVIAAWITPLVRVEEGVQRPREGPLPESDTRNW